MSATPFTASRAVTFYRVGVAMSEAGLPDVFVQDAVELASQYEGAGDLLLLWQDETDPAERDEIVADLHDLILDHHRGAKAPSERPYVRFDDLDAIAADVRAFKDSLRLIVDEQGGVSRLAELTGMPQPSISRFFSSDAMPRRATLLKFAKALHLGEIELATPWQRS